MSTRLYRTEVGNMHSALNQPIVIDNGTGFVKAGFSGQDLPRLEIPTVVGEHTEQVDPNMVN